MKALLSHESGMDSESQVGTQLSSVQTCTGQRRGVECMFVSWRGLVTSCIASLICFLLGQHRRAPFIFKGLKSPIQARCQPENSTSQGKLYCSQQPFGNLKGVIFSCHSWGTHLAFVGQNDKYLAMHEKITCAVNFPMQCDFWIQYWTFMCR